MLLGEIELNSTLKFTLNFIHPIYGSALPNIEYFPKLGIKGCLTKIWNIQKAEFARYVNAICVRRHYNVSKQRTLLADIPKYYSLSLP